MLLGFATGPTGRHLSVRRLRDAKIKPQLEIMSPRNFRRYAATCGEVLARAHARTADAVVLSAYLGRSAAFDEAIGAFAAAYAKQTERDHEALLKALTNGLLPISGGASYTPNSPCRRAAARPLSGWLLMEMPLTTH